MTTKNQGPEASPPFTFRGCAVQVTIDLGVYRLAAVQKSAYKFAERFTAVLGAQDANHLPVTFIFRTGTTEQEALEAVRLFFQELLDQELREQIGGETRAIRALIIAQAFSRTDLIKQD